MSSSGSLSSGFVGGAVATNPACLKQLATVWGVTLPQASLRACRAWIPGLDHIPGEGDLLLHGREEASGDEDGAVVALKVPNDALIHGLKNAGGVGW